MLLSRSFCSSTGMAGCGFQWARFNHTRKNGDAEFAADLKKNLGLDMTL